MLATILLLLIIIAFVWLTLRYQLARRKRKNTIAFFHLYCSSGGGGERVLWHAIKALLKKYPNYTIYVYSHKNIQDDTLRILLKVRELFKLDLISDERIIDRLEFVPLRFSPLVEAKRYSFLTLLFQNIGSMLLACEAAYRIAPEIYMETIGFTFTLPIFKLHRCTVITYVHYPTISSDMIQNVRTSSHASFNNREIFVRSPLLRQAKLVYYKILAYLYGFAGRRADLVLVNSSWTQAHIKALWQTEAHVVFPPCDVESFKSVRGNGTKKQRPNSRKSSVSEINRNALNIISIAQFRPEKHHHLQIEAFDLFVRRASASGSRLTLYGGCRDDDDRRRVDVLKDLVHRLGLDSYVDIVVGASFEQLLEGMRDADVAIHTMKNEHFGIVLLECMAAGLIMVAHNSGGPRTDIVDNNENGFLADTVEEFAEKLALISRMSEEEREVIRASASKKSDKFSTKIFEERLIELVDQFMKSKR